MTALVLQEVSKHHKHGSSPVAALRGVSLSVGAGEMVAPDPPARANRPSWPSPALWNGPPPAG